MYSGNNTVSSSYRFPAQVEPNGIGGFIASFKDVPEALTEAATVEELKENALDALVTAIDFYIEDRRAFPSRPPLPKRIWSLNSLRPSSPRFFFSMP